MTGALDIIEGLTKVILSPEEVLVGDLERLARGEIVPSLTDIVRRLQNRIDVLQQENEQLKNFISVAQPKKKRSPGDWRFRVTSFEWVQLKMYPADQAEGKVIQALRLHVPPEDMPAGPAFWDITRKREIAVLEPLLPLLVRSGRYVHIIQEGDGPTSVSVIRLEPIAL